MVHQSITSTKMNNNNNNIMLTLSTGVLPRMLQEGTPNPAKGGTGGGIIILQVINYKMVDKKSPNQPLRYRVVLSDGEYRCMGMLGSNLNHWITSNNNNSNNDNDNEGGGDFKYSVLKITNFISNMAGGKALLVILDAELMERGGSSAATRGVMGGKTMAQLIETSSLGIMPNSSSSSGGGALSNSTNNQAGSIGGGSSIGGGTSAAAASSNPYGATSGGGPASRSNPYGSSLSSPGSNPYGKSSHTGTTTSGHGSGAPIVRSSSNQQHEQQYTLISNLNMYQSRWVIKARVTSKSEIRTWSNAKGEGSLFSIEMLDASGADVRATFFKEAVDRFYNMLVVGQVFTFAGGRLKVANMQYNTCSSQYEITFDQNSEIHLQNDDDGSGGSGGVPRQNYDFVKIAALEDVHVVPSSSSTQDMGGMQQQQQQQQMQHVDVLGIVMSIGEPTTIVSKKSGKEVCKCDVAISDDSNAAINLTLWGEQARTAPSMIQTHQIVAFRRCRLSDFGGRSLSGPQSMSIITPTDDASIPEAAALRTWWQQNGGGGGGSGGGQQVKQLSGGAGGAGGSQRLAPLQDRKDIAAIQREGMGLNSMNGGKADYISFKANISFLKNDKEGGAWYPACPNAGEPCRNRFKVTPMTNDTSWFCDKCQGTFSAPVRRWIFSGVVEDDSSSTWVSFFNEQGETLFGGKTADEIYHETYGGGGSNMDAYESLFYKANHTEWILTCRVKNETYQDGSGEQSSRVKTSVTAMHPMDYRKEALDLFRAIEQF